MNKLIDKLDNQIDIMQGDEIRCYYYLMEVFQRNDKVALDYYLSKGLSINPRNEGLQSSAHLLIYSNLEFAQYAVSKGLDLQVLDLQGRNLLFQLIVLNKQELIAYVMQQGVNPYEKHLGGLSALNRRGVPNFVTPSFVADNSHFEKDEFDIKEMLIENNFSLALKTIQSKIERERMGGLDKIVNKLDSMNAYNLFRQLYSLLLLNKEYSAGNALLNIYIQAVLDSDDSLGLFYMDSQPILPFSAILLGNDYVLSHMIDINQQNSESMHCHFGNVFTYSFASKVNSTIKERVHSLKVLLRNDLEDHDEDSLFAKINQYFFENDDYLPDMYVEVDHYKWDSFSNPLKKEYLLNLAMLAFSKDDFKTAVFYLFKVIDLSKNNGMDEHLFAMAHFMIDYIDNL